MVMIVVMIVVVVVIMHLSPIRKAVFEPLSQRSVFSFVVQRGIPHDRFPNLILLISEETLVEQTPDSVVINLVADEDNLLASISPFTSLLDVLFPLIPSYHLLLLPSLNPFSHYLTALQHSPLT